MDSKTTLIENPKKRRRLFNKVDNIFDEDENRIQILQNNVNNLTRLIFKMNNNIEKLMEINIETNSKVSNLENKNKKLNSLVDNLQREIKDLQIHALHSDINKCEEDEKQDFSFYN